MKLVVLFFSFLSIVVFSNAVIASDSFEDWLVVFRTQALESGISEKVLDEAFLDMKPIEKVVDLDKKQPEVKLTLDEYLKKTLNPLRIKNGQENLAENKKLLADISKEYSVPANVIVALWGMESNYGSNAGNFNVIHSLATLAYDGRRSEFFRKELLNALKIMQSEKLSVEDFEGSWAGAFGQCQFMPSSFLRYAVDGDSDGKRDIWNDNADIFASIANYIHSEGWNINEGAEEGSNNFKTLLKWNRSRYFATAVVQLANEIGD